MAPKKKTTTQKKKPTKKEFKHHLDRRASTLSSEGAAKGPADQLITTPVLCAWLGVSLQWAEIGRVRGYGPPFKKLGHSRVRYRRGDVLAWLEERTHRCTSEYAA